MSNERLRTCPACKKQVPTRYHPTRGVVIVRHVLKSGRMCTGTGYRPKEET